MIANVSSSLDFLIASNFQAVTTAEQKRSHLDRIVRMAIDRKKYENPFIKYSDVSSSF
jgi:hypothetical protein